MTILIRDTIVDGKTRDMFIRDGVIEEISPRCRTQADRVVDGREKIALPSFINGHTHAAMTLMRSYADDMPLKQWLEERIWVLEAKLTEEDVYWGAKLACLEMIKNGITAFNDMYWHFEGTARAVQEMGIQGIISAVLIDMFDPVRAEEQVRLNTELFEKSAAYGRGVTFALGPHAVYSVSQTSLDWVRDFSEEHQVLVHMHLAETEDEVAFCKERYGLSPVEFLDARGLLSPRFIGCHGCWLDDEDCALLERAGAKLVHNPVSNLKLAVGRLFPYRMVRDHAIPFCLGTDGCSSNNHLDLVETMKFASLLAKFSTDDPTFLSARETFAVATKAAASIFSLGDWEIREGARTDIILISTDRPEMVPNFDVYPDIVYAANGYAVDTVICRDKVLMENRHVEGEEEIIDRARRVARDIVGR